MIWEMWLCYWALVFFLGDVRLRTLPFPVRRPTFSEVKRVHTKLATLYHPFPVTEKLEASSERPSNSNKTSKIESTISTSTTATEPKDNYCKEESMVKSQKDINFPDTKIDLDLDSSQRKENRG